MKVWDAQTGTEKLALKGHTGGVTSVAFSPDGKRIVTGSAGQDGAGVGRGDGAAEVTRQAGKGPGGRSDAAKNVRTTADLQQALEPWARVLHLDMDGKFERSRALLAGLGADAKAGLARDQHFENRGHFFAAAGQAMRRVLVDHARRKLSAKRGGSAQQVPLADLAESDADERLVAVDEALTQLAADDPLLARVVELQHFAGLPLDQVAAVQATTVDDVRQKWTFARAWLKAAKRRWNNFESVRTK